ncbi:hypothetical protein V8C26DRAFT_391539 [Trichoderma gracile]
MNTSFCFLLFLFPVGERCRNPPYWISFLVVSHVSPHGTMIHMSTSECLIRCSCTYIIIHLHRLLDRPLLGLAGGVSSRILHSHRAIASPSTSYSSLLLVY